MNDVYEDLAEELIDLVCCSRMFAIDEDVVVWAANAPEQIGEHIRRRVWVQRVGVYLTALTTS